MGYAVGDRVMSNWTLTQKIGEGSFGKVFEAQREDFGKMYQAAIKIISIPQSESEVETIRGDGMDEESVASYFESLVSDFVNELDIMAQLKGNSYIVSYEDHQVIPHEGSTGWDIIIRMELLTPFLKYVREREMTQEDAIQVGIDLCKALELCQKHQIIHRDIKPENIFVSDAGNYKLGDFGIARTVEKTSSVLSKKGTYSYMAPEVYLGQSYGVTADIYSLGMVLYWLCNCYRVPFLPAYPAPVSYRDREDAIRRRMSGEITPPPSEAGSALAKVILKACAFSPAERYQSASELRHALEQIDCRPESLMEMGEEPAEERTELVGGQIPEGLGEETVLISPQKVGTSQRPVQTPPQKAVQSQKPQTPPQGAVQPQKPVQAPPQKGEKPQKAVQAPQQPRPKKKMGRGAVVGICAGVVAVLVLVAGLLLYRHVSIRRASRVIGQAYTLHHHTYALYDPPGIHTWAEAQDFCEEQGGHLATFEDQEESDFLLYLLEQTDVPSAFFGLCDWGEDGMWVWYDGQPAEYTNWAEGEPNCQDGKEHYGLMFQSDDPKYAGGKWIDAAFPELTTGATAFVCEWDYLTGGDASAAADTSEEEDEEPAEDEDEPTEDEEPAEEDGEPAEEDDEPAPTPQQLTSVNFAGEEYPLDTTEVDVYSAGITDISPLSNLTDLEMLSLNSNEITDISPLADLTNLEFLWLSYNQISDVDVLGDLTNLRYLCLSSNEVADIDSIGNLTSLEDLWVDDNQITDIGPLSDLTNMEELWLSNNQITDLSPLRDLTNLESLSLSFNGISDISPLNDLTNLTSLSVSNNSISDISVLSDMNYLSYLDLGGNSIFDIYALSGLTNLDSLYLNDNLIVDVSPCGNLTNLTALSLSGNPITDISALSGLTKLKSLSITYTDISDISALSGMTNLESLYLNNNQITDVSALSGLTNLVWLTLDGNSLSEEQVDALREALPNTEIYS